MRMKDKDGVLFMDDVAPLLEEDIKAKLKDLPGWQYADDKIFKQIVFADFLDALKFVDEMAPYFESVDHHPYIHIFYNKILFELQRFHSGNKVTAKDFHAAHEIEERYALRKGFKSV